MAQFTDEEIEEILAKIRANSEDVAELSELSASTDGTRLLAVEDDKLYGMPVSALSLSEYLTKAAAEEEYQPKLLTWGYGGDNDYFGLMEIATLGTLTLAKSVGEVESVGTVRQIDYIGTIDRISQLGTIEGDMSVSAGTIIVETAFADGFMWNGHQVATLADVPSLSDYLTKAEAENAHNALQASIDSEASAREELSGKVEEMSQLLSEAEHELGNVQTKLNYYKEGDGYATIEVGDNGIEIGSDGVNVDMGDEGGEFTYNKVKVATANDIDKKQDALSYYSEGDWQAKIAVGDEMIVGFDRESIDIYIKQGSFTYNDSDVLYEAHKSWQDLLARVTALEEKIG